MFFDCIESLQIELDVDDVEARVDGLGEDVALEQGPSLEVPAVGVSDHHSVAVAQALDGVLVRGHAEGSYPEPDLFSPVEN